MRALTLTDLWNYPEGHREFKIKGWLARGAGKNKCSRCGDTTKSSTDAKGVLCWRCTYTLGEIRAHQAAERGRRKSGLLRPANT